MRGGFLHNTVMVARIEKAFQESGVRTRTEVFVRCKARIGYVDLVAYPSGGCIAVEVECEARRLQNDLFKARALNARELWIVTPTTSVAQVASRARQRGALGRNSEGIWILTLGQALSRVTDLFPKNLEVNGPGKGGNESSYIGLQRPEGGKSPCK